MAQEEYNMHYVSTLDEARKLIAAYDKFYVSNCNCRQGKGSCSQSRMDVCLHFNGDGKKSITLNEVNMIIEEAKSKHLVSRPFRSDDDKNVLDGICFCCNDCCYYFTAHEEECDKGAFIESTSMDDCTSCGNCVDACYFKARKVDSDQLVINRDQCYGCGLCVDTCPSNCISMIEK
jgi:ferredoxin